ncbi:hypothetical protein NMR47_003497 [Vibrio cholerae]|nr:hypothetical protein [Vibrio cholerae]EGR3950910.1 hypothetical protein [Vibrio cholerae]EHP5029311.1 hypothetical protein [Vibrio cholerae]EIJ0939683.1 hypothetical protein [Vibrio cholerae]EJL6318578.1 hypothetical protein [Vibrio cholerae]
MKEHSKSDDSEMAEKQQQAVDMCQLADEAFKDGLIKSRENLDAFLEQKIRIVMASELENRSENDAQELLEKRKKQIALLALCLLGEEDIQAGRGLTSEEIKERLQTRKQELKKP